MKDQISALPNVIPLAAQATGPDPKPGAIDDVCLPAGYLLDENGVWLLPDDGGAGDDPVFLSKPFLVTARCRRVDGTGWGKQVEFQDPDGRHHAVILDAAMLNGAASKLVAMLADRGLMFGSAPKANEAVAKLIRRWAPKDTLQLVDALGWTEKGASFVLGDGRVIGEGSATFAGQNADLAAATTPEGTLENWRRDVALPCIDNPLAILALSQAFSGPLLRLLGIESGGFHLVGASSCGKSTLLQMASSVWGKPRPLRSWRSTDNALEPLAAACCDTLLVLDELGLMDPQKLGEAVYLLGNGRGKARMESNTHVRPGLVWRVSVLSSGEISLEAHMASARRTSLAGQHIRLVDLAADRRPHGAFDALHSAAYARSFADALAQSANDNHGHAGPAFADWLIPRRNRIAPMQKFMDAFQLSSSQQHDMPQDPQVQRVVRRFALTALAGELATNAGLTGWPKGTATDALRELVGAWFEEQEKASHSEVEGFLEKTRRYLRSAAGQLVALDDTASAAPGGWMDETHFYLRSETWRNIHGGDPQLAARIHHDAGMLRCNKEGLQYRMPRVVPGQPRVYAVHRRILLDT